MDSRVNANGAAQPTSRKALAAVGATQPLTIAKARGCAQPQLAVIAEQYAAPTAASALRLVGG